MLNLSLDMAVAVVEEVVETLTLVLIEPLVEAVEAVVLDNLLVLLVKEDKERVVVVMKLHLEMMEVLVLQQLVAVAVLVEIMPMKQ